MRKLWSYFIINNILAVSFLLSVNLSFSQKVPPFQSANNYSKGFITQPRSDLLGTVKCFIKNAGQYGTVLKNYENMGPILYGYEGLGMPVLFTSKGLIHLQRKIEGATEKEKEEYEKKKNGKVKISILRKSRKNR